MTPPIPVGYLDFFMLEASDYIEQLDGVLLAGGAHAPDAGALQRIGRALRGSATMAKLNAFAAVAAGIERVGRALHDGELPWSPALGGVLLSAVDDCKVLLHNVRTWSDADEQRARARIHELSEYAPVRGLTPLSAPNVQGHDSFLANEAANIGAGLELLATRPGDRDAAVNVLKRVRALRGIASVKDHAALADVLEGSERAAHPLEMGEGTLSVERVALLSAAATVLRSIAAAIRIGAATDAASTGISVFAAALEAMQEGETDADRVVPISELFYADGGATVVERSANPPTTPAQRFRLEVVSKGEHLRRLVGDARESRDDLALERVRRDLRHALRGLRLAAESFGERETANFIASHLESVVRLDANALDALDEVAALLSQPAASQSDVGKRVDDLKTSRAVSMTPIPSAIAFVEPDAVPEERVEPAAVHVAAEAVRAASPAPSLADLLDAGIKTLGALARAPLATPTPIAEQPPVPIEVLLYRGRAALERCVEIREDLRHRGGAPDPEALNELFDLLDLALTS